MDSQQLTPRRLKIARLRRWGRALVPVTGRLMLLTFPDLPQLLFPS